MPSNNSNNNLITPSVCLSQSRDEWVIIRECYVKSFFTYPLYKYIEPDPVKREKFLRAYMDANYDVTVGNGEGIVLAVRIPDEKHSSKGAMKTIGGALLVPPSASGSGWAVESDEPYWKAYEEYGMREISEEGLQRVKRYEDWENKNLAQKATRTRIPLWNGLFCAIEPEYASKGFGSSVYKRGVKIMAQHWFKIRQKHQNSNPIPKKPTIPKPEQEKPLRGLMRSLSCQPPRFNDYTFQKSLSQDALFGHNCKQEKSFKGFNESQKSLKVPESQSEAPLAIVISHSDRAAHFHCANGFHPITRIPFHDPVENVTPFTTHVLVLDPFNTGRIDEFISELNGPQKVDNSEVYEPREKALSFANL